MKAERKVKTFDTSTLKGLKQAERFKARLENDDCAVFTKPVGLDRVEITGIPRMPVRCDQCEMVSINGVACHETGCPNMGARWDAESERWVKQRVCFECGETVDAESLCCSVDDFEEV